jgi:acyl carrier protein
MANDAPLTTAPSSLERAIVRRLIHLLNEESLDAAAVDCHASFFAPAGFFPGDYMLDSFDIFEVIAALQLDFNINIVDTYDVIQYDSIAKLSLLVEQTVEHAWRAGFESEWSSE